MVIILEILIIVIVNLIVEIDILHVHIKKHPCIHLLVRHRWSELVGIFRSRTKGTYMSRAHVPRHVHVVAIHIVYDIVVAAGTSVKLW